jgi:Regulator of ribonuclease activity B
MISVEMIEDLFERTRRLRKDGRVKWDIDDVCRWSYFFVDSSPEKLLAAGHQLEGAGYEIIGLLEPGPEDEDQETIYLRVDRVEKHTVTSLLTRNDELYTFAARLGLQDYDGMDSGAVDGP